MCDQLESIALELRRVGSSVDGFAQDGIQFQVIGKPEASFERGWGAVAPPPRKKKKRKKKKEKKKKEKKKRKKEKKKEGNYE